MDDLFKREDKQKSISRATPRSPKQQANDIIFDTLAAEFFPSGVGPDDKSRIGRVVRNLKAKSATPDEIRRRIANFPHKFPKCDTGCTLEGLNRQWDKLADGKPHIPGRNPKLVEREAHERATLNAKLKQEAYDRRLAMEWYEARREDPRVIEIRKSIVSAANEYLKAFYRRNLEVLAHHIKQEWHRRGLGE